MTDKLSLEGLNFQATKLNIANNVLTLTLNRPEKKNALNNVMMNEINYALAYAKQERSIRVVIIAAEGDVFCAGADLNRKEEKSNVPKSPPPLKNIQNLESAKKTKIQSLEMSHFAPLQKYPRLRG